MLGLFRKKNYKMTKEEQKIEELKKRDKKKENMIEFHCKGTYGFLVKENEESFEEWKERTGDYNRSIHSFFDIYHSHSVAVKYDVEITYNNITYNLNNEFQIHYTNGETNCYRYIFKIVKGDEETMENMNEKLKRDIIRQFEKHIKENYAEEMRRILEENNKFTFNFVIETEKTEIM